MLTFKIRNQIICKLALLAFISTCALPISAETYVWDKKKLWADIPRAILKNNTLIEEIKPTVGTFGQSVNATSLDNREKKTLVKNDIAHIAAAFPNNSQSSAVILIDDCSGTICDTPTLTVVTPAGKFIRADSVYSPSKITLTINNGEVTGGRAEGIPIDVDGYGSTKYASHTYLPSVGFIFDGFKREYSKLIGQHPDSLFSDEFLRKKFVKEIGLETFRELRHAISVASPAELVNGRYIVMQGCVPHMCGGNYAFVMIDAITSDFYWARYDDPKNLYSGGSRPITKNKSSIDSALTIANSKNYGDVKLIVTSDGYISYIKKR